MFVPSLKHMNTSRVNTTIINPTVTSNLPPNDTNNRSEQSIVQWSLFLFLLINYNLFYLCHCTFKYRVFNSFLVKNRFCKFGNIDWLTSSPRMFACFSQNWYSKTIWRFDQWFCLLMRKIRYIKMMVKSHIWFVNQIVEMMKFSNVCIMISLLEWWFDAISLCS